MTVLFPLLTESRHAPPHTQPSVLKVKQNLVTRHNELSTVNTIFSAGSFWGLAVEVFRMPTDTAIQQQCHRYLHIPHTHILVGWYCCVLLLHHHAIICTLLQSSRRNLARRGNCGAHIFWCGLWYERCRDTAAVLVWSALRSAVALGSARCLCLPVCLLDQVTRCEKISSQRMCISTILEAIFSTGGRSVSYIARPT